MKLQLDIDAYSVAVGTALYLLYLAACSRASSRSADSALDGKSKGCACGDEEADCKRGSPTRVGEPEAEPRTPGMKEQLSEAALRWSPVLLLSLLALLAVARSLFAESSRVQPMGLLVEPRLDEFVDERIPDLEGGSSSDSSVENSSGSQAPEIIRLQLSRQHGVSREEGTLIYKSAYYGTLNLGSPAVPYTFVFDTGSGNLVLPSTFCKSEACKVHKRYRKSNSSTARDIDHDGTLVDPGTPRDQLNVQFGTGDITGIFVEDKVCMETKVLPSGAQSDSGCVKMRFVSAIDMSAEPFSTFDFDGILGLGLSSLSQTPEFNFINMMGQAAGMGWKNGPPVFAIFLASDSHETSELSLGGVVEEHLQDEVRWSPVIDPENGHWMVRIKSLRVDDEVIPFCSEGEGCKAVVDSGTALLSVPSASFSELYRGLWHAGSLDGECNGDGPKLHFELDDLTITLGPEDYARPEKYKTPRNYLDWGKTERRNDLYCRPLLMSMDMPEPIGPKLFILGEPVLRKYYTVYDSKAKRVGLGLARHAPVPPPAPVDDSDDAWFFEEDDEGAP